jgi:hypothetical protein
MSHPLCHGDQVSMVANDLGLFPGVTEWFVWFPWQPNENHSY